VGECLTHWLITSFHGPLALSTPKVHSSDPAFDLVAVNDARGQLQTVCLQSKLTAGNANSLVSDAVEKYDRLHSREFDFELANELWLLAQQPDVRSRLGIQDWRKVLMDPNQRQYAIFVAFDGRAPGGTRSEWSAKWAEKIEGPSDRRLLLTLQLDDCDAFIAEIARMLHASIT
jgi:hypothetical protein